MRIKIFWALVAFLFFSSFAFSSEISNFLSSVQLKYKDIRGIKANFAQTDLKFGKKTAEEPAVGNIFLEHIEKSNSVRFRWQILSPNPSLVVTDGSTLWLYTPPFREGEEGQVQIRKAYQADFAPIAKILLGTEPFSKMFNISKISAVCDENTQCFHLVPKQPLLDIEAIEVYIERNTKFIYKIVRQNLMGRRIQLELKDFEINPVSEKGIFKFTVPPHTEVIR